MKAAILHQPGTRLEIADVPTPQLKPSSIRVRVLATPILSFTHMVVGGQFPFPLPVPYTPGLCAIGTVEEVAGDVTGLRAGQKVFCSPLIADRNNADAPERILKGWIGMTPNCGHLLEQWKEGTFAEQTVYPIESVTPIDDLGGYADEQLACMYYSCIAYGAFLRGDFRAGQSVVVTGATGNLGTASVLVALALGADKIYAVGRNAGVLQSLASLDPRRIVAVPLPGAEEEYAATLAQEVEEADLLVDAVGIVNSSALLEAGMSRLKQRGTAVFLGGVIAPVPVSYLNAIVKELDIKGSSMYPREAPAQVARMIRSGLLRLDAFRPVAYPLSRIEEAIAYASRCRGLEYCVLKP
ncbi:quinone oxidoreductase family protein [Cohnella zeiphila]|uniref:Zinc-binding alcohol dehydrogenase family protein n=1 Tax=Cohnella zeiphila TaxID=2761120 RepID=A0A7X0VZ17_9BACL|nr:zinc-binding alcohol dehydrogenase family protein [Cohnella zeiphila]MBB6735265.1 zinc-binding alcohol dehydrogenase family protein [Cohnella zeiphila]